MPHADVKVKTKGQRNMPRPHVSVVAMGQSFRLIAMFTV